MKSKFTIILIVTVVIIQVAFSSDQTRLVERNLKYSATLSLYKQAIEKNNVPILNFVGNETLSPENEVSIILYGDIDTDLLKSYGVKTGTKTSQWTTAKATVSQIEQIQSIPNLSFIELSFRNDQLCAVANSDSVTGGGWKLGNGASLVQSVYDGNDVLFGIIDTGVDWSHLDFHSDSNPNVSRIQYIWDMVTPPTGGRVSPSGFSYGSEYTNSQINNEIDGTPVGFVTSMTSASHGTTVAGIAVGDGSAYSNNGLAKGVAPKTDLLVVRVNQSTSVEIIDGVNWLLQKATQLGKPIVINISLGGHLGAHDGSRVDEQYISTQTGAGKIVVIAAGNSGNSNIHSEGTVISTQSTTFNVGSGTTALLLDLWYSGGDTYIYHLENPTGSTLSFNPNGDYVGNFPNNDFAEIYNGTETVSPITNGDGRVVVYISDLLSNSITAGTWTMTLEKVQNSGNGTWDAWIAGTAGGSVSFTSNNNTNKTLTMPATATNAITVANYSGGGTYFDVNNVLRGSSTLDGRRVSTSSRGPTRSGLQKPEISAVGNVARTTRASTFNPGSSSLLAGGFHYVSSSGTSFASPQVAGAVALLLQKWNNLTPTQVKSKLSNNSIQDSQTGTVWNNNWGFGKLYVPTAIQAVSLPVQQNTPIQFANTSATLNFSTLPMGDWSVNVDKLDQTPQNLGSASALPFYYSITSSIPNGSFSTSIEISYTDSEVGLLVEDFLTICTFDGLNWIPLTNQVRSPILNKVSATTDHFSLFAILDSEEGTLPVFLSSFQAFATENFIRLQWRSESELDNAYWLLERRTNSQSLFQTIARLNGRGTTNEQTRYSWLDYQVIPNTTYEYRLIDVSVDGNRTIHPQTVTAMLLSSTHNDLPTKFSILQNYPNPFNASTTFRVSLPIDSKIDVTILDTQGRMVERIFYGEKHAGTYSFNWHPKWFSSGVYFLQVRSTEKVISQKILYIR